MKPADNRVVIVGAGVVGLSCAVLLAEAGYDTNVLARELPRETYSAYGAGLWLPQLVSPGLKLARWAGQTYSHLTELADDGAGITLQEGVLLHREVVDPPFWSRALDDLLHLAPVSGPAAGYDAGFKLTAPVVDMPRYLDYLTRRLDQAGGILTRMPLSALPERGLVVNCSGVAARALARDWQVHPVRGQLAVVRNPGLESWFIDDDGPVYALPHGDQVLIGATADLDAWDTTPEPLVSRMLLDRAAAVEPRLADAEILGHRVGLRPLRSDVRLDVVAGGKNSPDRVMVHCYGHGGAGLTLSWGCAREVLTKVEQLEPVLF